MIKSSLTPKEVKAIIARAELEKLVNESELLNQFSSEALRVNDGGGARWKKMLIEVSNLVKKIFPEYSDLQVSYIQLTASFASKGQINPDTHICFIRLANRFVVTKISY